MDALGSEAFLISQNAQAIRRSRSMKLCCHWLKPTRDSETRIHLLIWQSQKLPNPREMTRRASKALLEAESLLSPDLTLQGVGPGLIAELYARLADFYGKRKRRIETS